VEDQPPEITDEPAKLPGPHSAALRAELCSELCVKPDAAIEPFLTSVEDFVAHFCDFERRETRQPFGVTRRELQRFRNRIETFSAAIRRLSDEALQEFDFGCWPDGGMKEPLESHARTVATLAEAAKLPAPSDGTPWSSYYRAHALLALDHLGEAIDLSLATAKRLPEPKGGSPRHLAWYHLAWQLGGAIEDYLGEQLSATSGGVFERLLGTCLNVGLEAIGSKRKVPEDLRPYTQDAVQMHKRLRIKPQSK
jgi:hypothetical protein